MRIWTGLETAWQVLRESVVNWNNDRAPRKGAALAFYMVFSLAPLLIITIAIAGIFFGEEAARGEIVAQVSGLIGPEGAQAIEAMIQNAARPETGLIAATVGFATLLIGATTALAELKDGLDQIWRVPPERTSGFWYLLRKRLASVGLILALGFLLLVSLVFSAAVEAMTRLWRLPASLNIVLQAINFILSFGLVTVLFAVIYKVLPSIRIAWGDVLMGAAMTSLLFSIGKYLIGVYIGNSGVTSTYGAAGSVILVLLWVYYSAQIFLLGAEFTRVYAHRFGSYSLRARGQHDARQSLA